MKTLTKKLRSPLKWHGGKSYLARRIIEYFPAHRTYVEPFIGGGSVLLNKPRSTVEVIADRNEGLMLFWGVVADPERFARFQHMVRMTDYKAGEFALAKQFVETPPWPLALIDRAEYAAKFLAWNRMSRGGLGKDFAWSDRLRGKTHPEGPIPGDANAWRTIPDEIQRAHHRLLGVNMHWAEAGWAIREYGGKDTLIYCDPPYLHETRTAKKAYAHEMGTRHHRDLLATLNGNPSMIVLSGYRSELYDHELRRWHRVEFSMPNHSGQGKSKQRRIECLWINPAAQKGLQGETNV